MHPPQQSAPHSPCALLPTPHTHAAPHSPHMHCSPLPTCAAPHSAPWQPLEACAWGGTPRAGKQHMARLACGKHSCPEFFVLVRRDRGLLCAATPRARTQDATSQTPPSLCIERAKAGQARMPPAVKVCLRKKLAQTWTSFLKTWVCLLIPKGKQGTGTIGETGPSP